MVAAVKPKRASKRITAETIREHAKKDRSPKWDGADAWSGEQFTSHFREAMHYYNSEFNAKDLKPKVIDWMGHNSYDKKTILAFKKTKDWRSSITMGAIASCLLKSMPPVHEGFNQGRNIADWLRAQITKVIADGKNDIDTEAATEAKKIKVATQPVVTVQDRIREQAGEMSEELDYAIDAWIKDPEKFDPKAFKIVNLLKGKGAKAAQSRMIKGFYQRGYDELSELASGNADDQLREAYKHMSRKNVRKMIEFYESIFSACDQIIAEAKVVKTRTKKVKPAEEIVKKLKFMISDTKLGITSVPPASVIGAQGVVVYNTKTRKIGYYISKTSAGLGVKNSTITEFTELSTQKTLRKPAEQIKEFKEQNTQKRFETWYAKNIKTTEVALNGRMTEDIIILKVFK